MARNLGYGESAVKFRVRNVRAGGHDKFHELSEGLYPHHPGLAEQAFEPAVYAVTMQHHPYPFCVQ